MNKKEIDCVSRGDEIGVTSNGAPRQVKYLLTIHYTDGTETSVMADGRCIAYLRDGFLVRSNERYQFYDADGQLVADKDMSTFGTCEEVAVLNDLYIFDTFGDGDRDASKFVYGQNRFVIDVTGNIAQVPDPMIGWPIDQLYCLDDEGDDSEFPESGVPTSLAALRDVVRKIGAQ